MWKLRKLPATLAVGLGLTGAVLAADGNRLVYLHENDPFHPGLAFPKLTTPQWVGEAGVEAVVILAIDDLREPAKYETFLRPLLDRLKRIDGRAPVSIFCNTLEPRDEQFQAWLKEGLSLEVHTLTHPCPLLARGDFGAAATNVLDGLALLNRIPGNRAVAFRMPCCDSMNSPSPRFYAEIFNTTNRAGEFLTMDSSVMNLLTTNDTALPATITLDAAGQPRFGKYLPNQTNAVTRLGMGSFVTTIADYPYPYVIGRLCWEFPPMVPSDWEAQNAHGVTNASTVADWKAALDATVLKQGTFSFIFHPHGWIRIEQMVEFVDYAVERYGGKVKFLTFREAQERLDRHLLAGQPLRAPDGSDNGVRLVDVDNDGYLDVIVGNEQARRTRVWQPAKREWSETTFPIPLVQRGAAGGVEEVGARFGVLRPDRAATIMIRTENAAGAWYFGGGKWVEDPTVFAGLEQEGQPVLTHRGGQDTGVRFRDLNGDGRCELIAGGQKESAIFGWSAEEQRFRKLNYALPEGTAIVDAAGRDNGLRFVDVNEDGFADLIQSNEAGYSFHLFVPELFLGFQMGWSREVMAGRRGEPGELPMIVRGGEHRNNGVWFRARHLWVQNEDTASLPNVVDRRSFEDLVRGLQPPPLAPAAALESMRVRPGFKVELVAHEPLVKDPVSFDFGADGKLWVVEMGDYPLGVDGHGARGGVARFLEDTDGDGRYDKSTVFLDGLNFPSGIMAWRKGVLISAAPEIFYAEDTDGDGKADLRQALYAGFIEGNQQHRANGFDYGLDNWLYGANGDSGGVVRWVGPPAGLGAPAGADLLPTRPGVNLSGHDFRLHPQDGGFATEAGQTQFGRRRDDWGNWFGNYNSSWGWHFFLPERYLARNPHLAVRTTRRDLAQYPEATRVHYISHRQQRFNDIGMQNYVTAACSPTPYRDELFGPEFATSLFVCEPVYNCIHREVLKPQGASFSSHRAAGEETREFLASTDNWFRPVFARTGPDGALYIADMYRLVIEHPEWIPLDTLKHIDLRAGQDMGRIYRVAPEGAALRKVPRLDGLDTAGLVAALESGGGWQRDTAQRLLVERGDARAAPLLEALVRAPGRAEASSPTEAARTAKTRLGALGALDGLGALTPGLLLDALRDPHPAVRAHAIRLCDGFLGGASGSGNAAATAGRRAGAEGTRERLGAALVALVSDASLPVAYQLGFTLGEWDDPRAGEALGRLALRHPENDDIQTAVLSSATPHVGPMLRTVLAASAGQPPPGKLLEQLLGLAAALKDNPALLEGLGAALRLDPARYGALQFTALAGFLDTLDRRNTSLGRFQREAADNLKQAIRQTDAVFARARELVGNANANTEERLAAIRVLGRGLGEQEKDHARLGELLQPHQASALQQAALAALKRGQGAPIAGILLAGWKSYSPFVRANVLDALFSRPEWVQTLLATLESGEVQGRDLNAAYQQKLLTHGEPAVRERAKRIFVAVTSDRQAVVDGYQSVATLRGDADRGAELFRQNCAVCHRLQGQGNAVGPDLAALTDKSPAAMLVAILDPNRVVEDRYISYTAVTRSDREFSGIITSETPGSITMRLAGGAEETLLRSDLTELSSSRLSLMPEGFENSLNPQGVADVVAYINASGPPPKQFAGNHPEVIKPGPGGALRLLAVTAEVHGDTLVFEDHYRNLGFWESDNDRAVWTLEVPAGGVFDVWLDWAAQSRGPENHFRLESGGARLVGVIPRTGSWDEYRQTRLGQIELPAGAQRLVFRGQPPLSGAIIDLRELRLVPAGSPAPGDFTHVRAAGR